MSLIEDAIETYRAAKTDVHSIVDSNTPSTSDSMANTSSVNLDDNFDYHPVSLDKAIQVNRKVLYRSVGTIACVAMKSVGCSTFSTAVNVETNTSSRKLTEINK